MRFFHIVISFNFDTYFIQFQYSVNKFLTFFPIPYGKVINMWIGQEKSNPERSWCMSSLLLRGYLKHRHRQKLPYDISSTSEHCSNSSVQFFTPQWEIIWSSFSLSFGRVHCKQWSLHDYVFGKYKHSLVKKIKYYVLSYLNFYKTCFIYEDINY